MKKLVLFVMAVMAFVSISVAQDVYSGGYFRDDDYVQQAAVYRNETRLYYSTIGNGTGNLYGECTGVDVYQGDVYWVRNCLSSDGGFYFADVMKNNNMYLNSPVSQGRHIYDLYRWPEKPETGLFAVGCMDINAVRTAVIWKDDNSDVYSQLGDGIWTSVAYAATVKDDVLYVCGYQYGYAETTYRGVIWEVGGSEFYFPEDTKIFDFTYSKESDCFYSVGYAYVDGHYKLKVWRNDMELYTLLDNTINSDRMSICVDDAGDVYVSAYGGYPDKVWKNGQEIFHTQGYITSVFANSNGVYCAGSESSVGKIWKDRELLYHPTNSEWITCLYVAEPECTNSEARTLPYFEGFETGATDWACWTVEDNDNYNGENRSYWHRGGENIGNGLDIPTGHNYAWHGYGPEYEPQEGWLTSPRIAIPEGGAVTLTFMTYEGRPDYYQYEGVMVVCNGMTEVWRQSYEMASDEWKMVEIDLSSYRGQEIQLAFKYRSTHAHDWYIDDVLIEQEAAPASYTITTVVDPVGAGTVTGGGTYPIGTTVSISATPFSGYYFIGWNDGNADNPRSITVTQDATYIAQFASTPVETFTLTVMCNSAEGSTVGSGTYTAGSTATIAAIPNSGFLFDKWNDDNTDNPRQVVVNSDMTFVAFFKGTGVGEDEGRMMVLYPNPANDHVRIEGIEANSEVRIYNAMGALVKVTNASANEEIGIGELSAGLYLLRCGNVTLRFVKM